MSDSGERKPAREERDYYLEAKRARGFDIRSRAAESLTRYKKLSGLITARLASGHLLDIGTGTAGMLIELARAAPGMVFTGIDVSAEMLRLAEMNVRKEGLGARIRLLNASAEELNELPAHEFDAVLSNGSFSGWLNPKNSLDEIDRILKPEGLVFISDWHKDAPLEAVAALTRGALGEPSLFERILMAFKNAYTLEEFSGILAEATPFELLELSAEEHWMTALLGKRSPEKRD